MAAVQFFFIRHNPTKRYLPHSPTVGVTHTVPEDPAKCRPRSFSRKDDAEAALGMWLLGKVYMRPGMSPHPAPIDDSFDIVPQPERTKMAPDMEVVCREIEL